MALINCPECGREVSSRARACPNCGYPIEELLNEIQTSVSQPKENIKIGSIIEFGSYPYEADGTVAPIKWRVLDVKENKALLITDKGIDCKKYNEEEVDITWETCTLRKWLNNNFFNTAFNDNEKSQIELTDVIAHENPEYNTNQGNNTKDKVFLLSIKEAKDYFSYNSARKCVPTEYAKKQRASQDEDDDVNGIGTCWYWLRSSGPISRCATNVCTNGRLSDGYYVNAGSIAVRPTLWLNL